MLSIYTKVKPVEKGMSSMVSTNDGQGSHVQLRVPPVPAVGTGDSKNLNHPFPDPTPTKLPAENPDTPESAQNPCRWKSPAAPHAPAPSAQSAHRSAVRPASSAQIRSPSASAPESAPTQSSGSPSASESAGFPAPFICQRV